MVLLIENTSYELGGSASPTKSSSTTSTTSSLESWLQVDVKSERKSLWQLKDTTSTSPDGVKIRKTSIWRTGHGVNSVFIDMTGRKETKLEFFKLVAAQYPSRVGILTQQIGNLKFAEINFQKKDASSTEFLRDGLVMNDKEVILPCQALNSHMEVVYLGLSNLPFLEEKALSEGLKKSLCMYGEILDLGILVEPETQTYECRGYAVLNISNKSQAFPFMILRHKIAWFGEPGDTFYVVWDQM